MSTKKRNQTKLVPKFEDPFRIAYILDHNRYLIKPLVSNRTYKYAHGRLKLKAMPDCYAPLELNTALEVDGCADDGGSEYFEI